MQLQLVHVPSASSSAPLSGVLSEHTWSPNLGFFKLHMSSLLRIKQLSILNTKLSILSITFPRLRLPQVICCQITSAAYQHCRITIHRKACKLSNLQTVFQQAISSLTIPQITQTMPLPRCNNSLLSVQA